ncbi:LOW QUALITY PROTEIN: ficolin-3 [Trichechus inunguis]
MDYYAMLQPGWSGPRGVDGGSLVSLPLTSLASNKLPSSLCDTRKMGRLTPLSLLLLLLGRPSCLRTQESPSCPEPREIEVSKIVLLPSCPGAPESPGEKGAPGPSGQPGPPGKMGPKGEPDPRSCQELLSQGNTLTGWYHLCLPESRVLPVFCDMDSAGGGLVFQRRQDSSLDFFRSWASYKGGFGSQESEFWLENENLYQLTLKGTWELRVELEDFSNRTFAHYITFRLLGEADHYQLVLGQFSEGTAGASVSFHSGRPFTTYDADHNTRGNCAVAVHRAWWYESCYTSNLNGRYEASEATAHKYGINWDSGRGVGYPYCRVRMMLR